MFERFTGVRSKNCFFYNNYLFFGVSPDFVSKAIGQDGKNVRRLAETMGKRIKIIALPEDTRDLRRFVLEIISPLNFRNLDVNENEVIITANRQNKAALIGRNKIRLEELGHVLGDFFGKKLKIV